MFRNTDLVDPRGCKPVVPRVKDCFFFKTNTGAAPAISGGMLNIVDLYGNAGKYNYYNFARNTILHNADGYYEPSTASSRQIVVTGIENGAAPCCDNFQQFTLTIYVHPDGCGQGDISRTYSTSTDCTCPTLIAVRLADVAAQMNADIELMERLGQQVTVTSTAITVTSALANFTITASAATVQEIDPYAPTGLTPLFIRETLKVWNEKSPIIAEIVDGTTYRVIQLTYLSPISTDQMYGAGSYGSREGQIGYTENLIWLIYQDTVADTRRDAMLALLGGSTLTAPMLGVLDGITVKKAIIPDYPYCSTKTDAGDAAALATATAAYEAAYPGKIVSLRRISYNGTASKYEVVMRGQATAPTVATHTIVKGQC